MNSSLIGKIEKARRYAAEADRRVHFEGFQVRFDGANGEHRVSLDGKDWRCTCDFFSTRGVCSHTMAMERILQGMLPEGATSQHLAIT